jgi:hypothetical protein
MDQHHPRRVRLWVRERRTWGHTWPQYRSGVMLYTPYLGVHNRTYKGEDHYSRAGAVRAARLARRLVLRRGIDPERALAAASALTKDIGAEIQRLREIGKRRLEYLCRMSIAPAVRESDGTWSTYGIPSASNGYWTDPFGHRCWPGTIFLALARSPIRSLLDVLERETGYKFLPRVSPKMGPPLDGFVVESPINWLCIEKQKIPVA